MDAKTHPQNKNSCRETRYSLERTYHTNQRRNSKRNNDTIINIGDVIDFFANYACQYEDCCLENLQGYICDATEEFISKEDPMYKCIDICNIYHIDVWQLAIDMCAWMNRI